MSLACIFLYSNMLVGQIVLTCSDHCDLSGACENTYPCDLLGIFMYWCLVQYHRVVFVLSWYCHVPSQVCTWFSVTAEKFKCLSILETFSVFAQGYASFSIAEVAIGQSLEPEQEEDEVDHDEARVPWRWISRSRTVEAARNTCSSQAPLGWIPGFDLQRPGHWFLSLN